MTEKTPVQEAIEGLEEAYALATTLEEWKLAQTFQKALAALRTLQSGKGEAVEYFQKCDGWGFREWYDRLQKAVKDHDAARVAGNDTRAEMCVNIITSTAFRLARDFPTPPEPVNSDKVDVEAVRLYFIRLFEGSEINKLSDEDFVGYFKQHFPGDWQEKVKKADGIIAHLATLGLLRSRP